MEHHVYFWLQDECQSAADRAVFEQGLASLFEIDLVVGGRWAVPAPVVLRPVIDQSWDYALTMQFASVEDHNAYQGHPQHNAFVETFKGWWARVLVMDLA
ncbi:MAG: Dabb family protein [Verrucomicrobia bacterium]|nr:Dabb family protein [Verrucomicrobiota bacterium]